MMRLNSLNIETGSVSLEQSRREFEEAQILRDLERKHETLRAMYSVPRYRVQFSYMLPDDKGCIIDNVIYIPESRAYKFIFMNNRVDDTTVGFAVSHAIQKVNQFIDNYRV